MKLPSIEYLSQQASQGFKRFPTTIISAILGTALLLYLTEVEDDLQNEFPLYNAILTFAIGLPIYLAVSILSRQYHLNKKWSIGVQLIAAGILLLIYISLPDQDNTFNRSVPYLRYVIYNIIAHLVVAFIPYLKQGQLNGFWNYNKLLFLRILTSLLYSGFLSLGIMLAMGAINLLFNAEIKELRFGQVYIFIQGIFNTWFFVSGIPDKLAHLDSIKVYPKGLKIFTQFILLPLLVVYLIILYFYAGKIILAWDWPEGIVAYLIICVAVSGIFNVLMIYPYGAYLQGNLWIKKFSRIYYFLLIPLVVLLFIAIGMRVNDYGFTINRYIIVILGVWLTFISGYFILGRRNIKIIPMSMAGILFLMLFGPWGMFSVGEKSQVNRLEMYLSQSGILVNGKIKNEVVWQDDTTTGFNQNNFKINDRLLTDSIHNEVVSIMEYLDNYHGFDAIQPWFNQDLDSIILARIQIEYNYLWENEAAVYLTTLGVDPSIKYGSEQYLYFRRNPLDALSIKGYDYDVRFSQYGYYDNEFIHTFAIDPEQNINIKYENRYESPLVVVIENDTTTIPIYKLISNLRNSNIDVGSDGLPQKAISMKYDGNKYRFNVILERLSLVNYPDSVGINDFESIILFGQKD